MTVVKCSVHISRVIPLFPKQPTVGHPPQYHTCLPRFDPTDHGLFMPVNRACTSPLDLFGEIALGDPGVNRGAGESGHALDILQSYNPVVHGLLLILFSLQLPQLPRWVGSVYRFSLMA